MAKRRKNIVVGPGAKQRVKKVLRDPGVVDYLRSLVNQQLSSLGVVEDNATEWSATQRLEEMNRNAVRGAHSALNKSGKKRTYSPMTRNFGRKILALGTNVPADVRLSAYAAAQGQGTIDEQQLLDTLREYGGVEKSGASFMNKFIGGVRRRVGQVARMGLLFDQAQRGGAAGAAAGMELTQQGIEAAESLTSSKTVQKIATTITDKLAKSPGLGLQFLSAVGRGLRMGGVLGAIAQAGVAVFQMHADNQRASAKALKSTYDTSFRTGVYADAGVASAERSRIAANVDATRSIYERVRDFFGFDAATSEEKARRTNEQYSAIAMGRVAAGQLGVDAGRVLSTYATSRGKSVSDLTQYERNMVLNRAVSDKLAKIRESGAAGEFANRQMTNFGSWKGNDQGNFITYMLMGQSGQAAMRERYREDFSKQRVNYELAMMEERERAIERFFARMEPQQRLVIDRSIREGRAQAVTQGQRHKMKWDD